MSLFSLDNILLQEENSNNTNLLSNNIINLDNIGTVDNDITRYSFVKEGYKFILEMNKEFHDADKIFYKSVLESYGDDTIINESFSGFFDKVKEIIKKFIEWIKKTFKQFVIKLNSLFKSEKYIKKNKNMFLKFGYEDEFEFKGYKFTKLNDPDIPLANAFDFITDCKGEMYNMDNYYNKLDDISTNVLADTNYKTEEERNNEITRRINQDISDNIDETNENLDDIYDHFRALVIKSSDKEISASDYANELFELFRDGYNSSSSITIDSNFISEAYIRFDKYKDNIKIIEKTKDNMVKDYEKLEKALNNSFNMIKDIKDNNGTKTTTYRLDYNTPGNQFASKAMDSFFGGSASKAEEQRKLYNTTTYDKLNSYAKLLATITNTMCSIHTQAFSAKLQAVKDCFVQDKKILYKALSIIQKHKKEY